MKKLLGLFILLSVFSSCFSQGIVNRSSSAVTIQDSRLSAQLNLLIPRFQDTTQANIAFNIGLDSVAAIIFSRSDNNVYIRQGNPKKWVQISTGTPANYWSRTNGHIYPSTIGDSLGIGTSTPGHKFEVNGDGYFEGALSTDNSFTAETDIVSNGDLEVASGRINLSNGYGTEGQVVTSHASSPTTWETPSAGTIVAVNANAPLSASGTTTRTISADTVRHNTGLSTYQQHYEDSLQIVANTAAITAKKNITDSTNAASGYTTLYQNSLKQNKVTLTTTGSSGASTFNQSTGALNIPQYSGGGTTTYEIQTASGSTTFTFTSVPASTSDYIIFVNGAKIRETTDYTTSGNVVTIPTIVTGDKVEYQRIK